MKRPRIILKLINIVMLILLTQALFQQPNSSANSPPPKPPATGTPKGNSTPGTTRPQTLCTTTTKPLTALNANNGSDFTAAPHPSLWFYVPYTQNDIRSAEFMLLDSQERTTIYQIPVKLGIKPGLIKIPLPSETKKQLQPNQYYRWYLMLNCQVSRSSEPNIVVDGWIKRQAIANNSNYNPTDKLQKYNFYIQNQLWYDAIDYLTQLRFQYPDNSEIQNSWNNLLKQLGKEWVIQEPLVD